MLGDSLREEWKLDEALEKYREAENKLKELPESPSQKARIARLKEHIGITHGLKNKLADYELASYRFKEAKELYRALGMQIEYARVEVLLGIAYENLGKYHLAGDSYADALKVYENLGHSRSRARAYFQEVKLGTMKATRHLTRLFSRRAFDKKVLLKLINNLKAVQQEISDQFFTFAEIEYEIGHALISIGKRAQTQKGIEHLGRAIDILRKPGLKSKQGNPQQIVAQANFDLGLAFKNLRKYSEAIRSFDVALEIFKGQGRTIWEANVRYHKGLAFMAQKPAQLELAQEELDESYEIMERKLTGIRNPEHRKSFRVIYFQFAETRCALNLLQHEETGKQECLRQALNEYDRMKCRSIAEVLGKEGGKVQGLTTQSLILKENALLKKMEQLENIKTALQGNFDAGKILEESFRSKIRDSEASLRTIYAKIEKLRLEIYSKCEDTGGMTPPRNFDALESLLELMPQTENCCILAFTLLLVAKIKPKESIRVDRTVENIPLTNSLIMFLINRRGEIDHFVKDDIDLDQLWKLSTRCQLIYERIRDARERRIGVSEINKELKELSRELYTQLIPEKIGDLIKKNLENKKSKNSHLIVVTDKFLNWVPFDILYDGHNYWGLKYSICTNFSLDLARLCIKRRIAKTQDSKDKLSFLIVKNPLRDLEQTDKAVAKIKGILKKWGVASPDILPHQEATKERFVEKVERNAFSVLHYAGHARMEAEASSSYLALHAPLDKNCTLCSTGEKGTHLSDPLRASEFIRVGIKFQHAPIIYLHACESGISEVKPGGDEPYGLTRAFMYAGATTIIASRWRAWEPSANLLAEEFYSSLLEGNTVGIALRNARRIVHKKKVFGRYPDWAAFFLQGDPFRKCAHQYSPQGEENS